MTPTIRLAAPADLATVQRISANADLPACLAVIGAVPKPASEDRRAAQRAWRLSTNTNVRMEADVRCYGNCGFTEVGRRPHPRRAGEFLVDMAKTSRRSLQFGPIRAIPESPPVPRDAMPQNSACRPALLHV